MDRIFKPMNELKPSSELSYFVEGYWEVKPQQRMDLFPDGTFNCIYSKTSFYSSTDLLQCHQPGIYLIPIQERKIALCSSGTIVGIRFKAFAYPNIRSNELFESRGENCNRLKQKHRFWERQLESFFKEELRFDERFAALEHLAFDLLGKHSIHMDLRAKVNYILDRKGFVKISDMHEEFGVSRQGLHKLFKNNMGISPKVMASIWQFNHFLTLSTQSESLTIASIDAGYFDQSHAIKRIKMKAEKLPSHLTSLNVSNYSIKCMDRRFSNYYDPQG